MFSIPIRDRQVALQLLLELGLQQGSLHCTLRTVHLLFELCDTDQTEQVKDYFLLFISEMELIVSFGNTDGDACWDVLPPDGVSRTKLNK